MHGHTNINMYKYTVIVDMAEDCSAEEQKHLAATVNKHCCLIHLR